ALSVMVTTTFPAPAEPLLSVKLVAEPYEAVVGLMLPLFTETLYPVPRAVPVGFRLKLRKSSLLVPEVPLSLHAKPASPEAVMSQEGVATDRTVMLFRPILGDDPDPDPLFEENVRVKVPLFGIFNPVSVT